MFDHPKYVAMAAIGIAGVWMLLAAIGHKPDGAVLGFAGTMLMIAGMQYQNIKVKDERDQRDDDDPDLRPPSPPSSDGKDEPSD